MINIYSDKFRTYDSGSRDQTDFSTVHSGGGTSSSGSGRSSKGRKGWEVIKKAIFTPIGTKDTSTHRRRRSRRNLNDNREQQPSDFQSTNLEQEIYSGSFSDKKSFDLHGYGRYERKC